MILGISASGRENGITSEVVEAVLEATGEAYEYVSLAGLQIGGCRGCTRCAADNRCKVNDD
jgi:multimeric flavodoxin WrbA